MNERGGVYAPITCDCGHQFKEPIAGVELESHIFTCPSCGRSDNFTGDQISRMVADYEAAVAEANKLIRQTAKEVSRAFKGRK